MFLDGIYEPFLVHRWERYWKHGKSWVFFSLLLIELKTSQTFKCKNTSGEDQMCCFMLLSEIDPAPLYCSHVPHLDQVSEEEKASPEGRDGQNSSLTSFLLKDCPNFQRVQENRFLVPAKSLDPDRRVIPSIP